MTSEVMPAPQIAGAPTAALARVRGEWQLRWSEASPRARTRVQLAALLGSVIAAYNYSLVTLFQNAGLDTPLAYVSLVPLIALAIAGVRGNPLKAEPAIHDRQVDYIVGVPLIVTALMINLMLPATLSVMFWVYRIDLLSLPLFVAGAVAIIFGTRILWRQKLAIMYLVLAWPFLYTFILARFLGAFTSLTLAGLKSVLHVVPVARAIKSQDGSVFEVIHHGSAFPLSVVTACSGVNGMVGFLLVGLASFVIVKGPRLRKTLWLAGGLVLLWVLNLARITFIFWAGRAWGEHVAMNILHPYVGLVTFGIGVIVMVLVIGPLGLRIGIGDRLTGRAPEGTTERDRRTDGSTTSPPEVPRAPQRREWPGAPLPVPKVFAAIVVVALAAAVMGTSNVGLKTYNLVADASGAPKLGAYATTAYAPTGWTSNFHNGYTWARSLFGEDSTWDRYLFTATQGGNLHVPVVVTADVIQTGNLASFSAYGVEACYQFHGYTLRDVTQVALGGGISGQAMSFVTGSDGSWSIVYWIVPVKGAAGTTRYERTVLFVQNTGSGIVVSSTGNTSGIADVSDALRSSDPEGAALIRNRTFLVAFARQLIATEAKRSTAPSAVGTTA